jgi:hypothetical protein
MTDIQIDQIIIAQIQNGPQPLADIVMKLMTVTSESYAYSRVRRLEALGLVKKTSIKGNKRILELTPEGQDFFLQVPPQGGSK